MMLTGNYFVDALPTEARQKLAFQLQPVKLHKAEILYLQGQIVDCVYFPAGAVVSQYQATADGDAVEVTQTGREAAVGLSSIYNDGDAFNSCEVLIGGPAWKIRTGALIAILAKDADLASDVMKLIDVQGKRMSRKMVCDRYHTVEQRLCLWFLGIADRSGKTSLTVSHAEAARALGVHRPTITDALHLLREKEAIEMTRLSVKIREDVVSSLVCECRESFPVRSKGETQENVYDAA